MGEFGNDIINIQENEEMEKQNTIPEGVELESEDWSYSAHEHSVLQSNAPVMPNG